MKTALITGGSGGIGLALAREFAKDGWSLVLVARDETKLAAAAKELGGTYLVFDLAQPGAAQSLFDEVNKRGLTIDALVNNAGYGMYGKFADSNLVEQEGMVALNIAALMTLTRLFLPRMVERKSGYILNVSSTAGFLPGPLMAVYYATKAFVNSFTVAVANELVGTGVSITALCPGATDTNFATRADMGNSKLFKLGTDSPEKVAAVGYKAMKAGKPIVIVGRSNALGAWFARTIPLPNSARIARRLQERE